MRSARLQGESERERGGKRRGPFGVGKSGGSLGKEVEG